MSVNVKKKGFTLIETLVYLAMLGLVFTGLFAAGFAIVESLDVLKARAIVQEEGNFLLAKINWAMNDAYQVDLPLSDSAANELTVRKHDGSKITVGLNGESFYWQNIDEPLDNSIVAIVPSESGTIFSHIGSGDIPEFITAKFTLRATTPTGRNYEQKFELTNYLRK
jgi:type II secretory pathway pseudopilin PulG